MAKLSKRVQALRAKVDRNKNYPLTEALALVKESATAKFDESVDIAVNLGVDAKKSDQLVRGSVVLPAGTGKSVRVAVFAQGDKAEAARAAGADVVGFDDLAEQVKGGTIDFDLCIATPDAMRVVGALGQILGPRGLMPNPKVGTVTMDTAKAVSDIKGGKIEFRIDRHANLQFIIGKASFDAEKLAENYFSVLDEILRLKPSASKGRYVRKIAFSATMSPSVAVDVAATKPAE